MMSAAVLISPHYDKRSNDAIGNTKIGADTRHARGHLPPVLSSNELLEDLRRLRDGGQTTNAELGRLLRLPSSRISEMFAGKRAIKIDEMKILVEHFRLGVPPEQPPTRSADAGGTVDIGKLDLSLSMGPGTLIGDYVEEETIAFDLALIRSITRSPPHRLKVVTGHGHSMEPTLQGSDMILIDTTERQLARQDGIYWIDLFGAAGLKRLRTVGKGRVEIISDNPAVGNQVVDADDLRIDGRAIWFARGL